MSYQREHSRSKKYHIASTRKRHMVVAAVTTSSVKTIVYKQVIYAAVLTVE
jgi:hypothetical protein